MTAGSVGSSKRGIWGFVVMAGAALMIVSVWLPWLDTQMDDPTGWDTYTALTDAGRNGFYEGNFFDSGFSPFFSGLTVLIAGCVVAAIGSAMVLSVRGGVGTVPVGARLAMMLLALAAVVVTAGNLFSLFTTGPGTGILDPAPGLYLSVVGGFVGFLGVPFGVSPSRA